VRKSAKKIFTACAKDEFWDRLKIIQLLNAKKLAAEIENRWHNKVNPETVQRVLRKSDFHGSMAKKKSFISQKNQREWNLLKALHWSVWNSGKQIYCLMKANIHLVQMGVIMCGEYTCKGFGGEKKCMSNRQTWYWECDGMRMHGRVRSWKSSFYQRHHEQHIYVNFLWVLIKATAENVGLKKILHFTMAMTQKVSSHLVRGWCLYSCP